MPPRSTCLAVQNTLKFLSGQFINNITDNLRPGPYIVRDAFIYNFGRRPTWWLTAIMALGMVIVFELAISAVRRIYWPQDQDLMQEAERFAGVMDVMKEHAAEIGEAGATATATGGDGKRASRDSAAGTRPSQQHEWNGFGSQRRRSRKISGDVYGAPPFMATPEERDVDPLGGAESAVGSSRDNTKGKQQSASTSAYQVGS